MNEKETKRISKFLSLILRHNPQTIGIELDKNGWANVEELRSKCAKRKVSFTRDQLEEVVETNDKQRFTFNEDKTKIRASQGHSISIDLELKEQEPPEYLYHGTVAKFMDSIKSQGLKKISRQHVHLSYERETATKVGSRRGKPIILSVRSGEMFRNNMKFYRSKNGVWLTDNVPDNFIEFK